MKRTLESNRLTEVLSRLSLPRWWARLCAAWGRSRLGAAGREIAAFLQEKDVLSPFRDWRGMATCAGMLAVVAGLSFGYVRTLRSITVEVDGQTVAVRSHLPTVGEALSEAGILLQPEDHIQPSPATHLESGLRVRIQRARTIYITVDGESEEHRTLATNVGEALSEAGVRWIPEDRITVAGEPVAPERPLYTLLTEQPTRVEISEARHPTSRGGRLRALDEAPGSVHIVVQRAIPIGVQDDQTPYTFLTTARTLGEALLEKGIVLYAADSVEPPLDTVVQAGMRAVIERSRAVTLYADGQIRQTRTRARTVAELLQEEGLSLGPLDYTRPMARDRITPGMRVTLVRVSEHDVIEEEPIPYELEYRSDPQLELDQQRLDNPGSPGVFKRSLRVRIENGIEASRTLEKEWVDRPPANRIVSYGTKIVERQIATAEGTFTYWRKIRVLVTAYTPATCGKTRGDPTYGIARTGMKATKGVIAVDPTVIALYTKMYVPGYGPGIAGDTGGLIKGQHIDLCYDENNFVDWWKWVDIYLLSPPPPRNKIRWTLPNWPRER